MADRKLPRGASIEDDCTSGREDAPKFVRVDLRCRLVGLPQRDLGNRLHCLSAYQVDVGEPRADYNRHNETNDNSPTNARSHRRTSSKSKVCETLRSRLLTAWLAVECSASQTVDYFKIGRAH